MNYQRALFFLSLSKRWTPGQSCIDQAYGKRYHNIAAILKEED